MAKGKRSSNALLIDAKKAHEKAVDYKLIDDVFINKKMKTFIEVLCTFKLYRTEIFFTYQAKGIRFAVDTKMMLPSFLAATSNVMNMAEVSLDNYQLSLSTVLNVLQLEFTEEWHETCNIYILLIAMKGAGKTPCSKTYFSPLQEVETEETKEFDDQSRAKRKAKKRKSAEMEGGHDEEGQEEGQEDDYDDDDTGSKGEGDSEQFRFHIKTRTCDSITPEALILSLKYGSGVLLIKSDEFKVRLLSFCPDSLI